MPIVDYNSQIAEVLGYRTLLQLRQALMRRLGFSTQVSVPPAGMTELLNEFLQSAQRALYMRPSVPRQERIYTWTMVNGIRFYGINDNEETGTGVGKDLSQYKVSWVGIERNGAWTQLKSGIPPEYYGVAGNVGYPSCYKIRQSIEVYPVPDTTEQYLRVVGSFGLAPFSADTDTPTIDDELVFLMALYLAKRHYGQPDANDQLQIMEATLRGYVSGTHQTNRYIHGSEVKVAYTYPIPTVPFT